MKEKINTLFKIKQDDKINKKKLIWLSFIIILFLGFGVSFGRYAYNELRDFYLSTKKFYFNSDKLTEDGALYEIDNWSGVGSYSITVNMNSYDNNNLYSEEDITYNISYSCSDNVTCSVEDNKSSGVIKANNNNDSFTIVITVPTDKIFKAGDSIELSVKADSVSPYKKSLSAKFKLIIGHYGLSYEISDSKNSPYLDVRITNTLDYYTVNEAFLDYQVGKQIDIETFLGLSAENKSKCSSAIITLDFDPRVVLLDMTSEDYLDSLDKKIENIDGYNYVTSISFKIDALSSEKVKFYKKDTLIDYSYPNSDNNSVVKVTYG